MPKINVDELCEPIEVTVGGEVYIVDDISPETAKMMEDAGRRAEKAGGDEAEATAAGEDLTNAICSLLGAEKAAVDKLGMRKRLAVIRNVMGVVGSEAEGKNVPKAAVTP